MKNFYFKIYDGTNSETNMCNTHTAQYLKKVKAARMKFGQVIEYDVRNIFLQKSCRILPKK